MASTARSSGGREGRAAVGDGGFGHRICRNSMGHTVPCYKRTMPPLPEFTELQIRRYARHIVLAEIGGVGQARLIAARVLVIGAGGLGAPLLQYLAAAGIGTLGVIGDG